jgi:hypothetical protein
MCKLQDYISLLPVVSKRKTQVQSTGVATPVTREYLAASGFLWLEDLLLSMATTIDLGKETIV